MKFFFFLLTGRNWATQLSLSDTALIEDLERGNLGPQLDAVLCPERMGALAVLVERECFRLIFQELRSNFLIHPDVKGAAYQFFVDALCEYVVMILFVYAFSLCFYKKAVPCSNNIG